MKKQNFKRSLAELVAATSILGLSTTGASTVWRYNSKGWWYTEGNSYSKGWRNIGGT